MNPLYIFIALDACVIVSYLVLAWFALRGMP
jgi:hypothetical protein